MRSATACWPRRARAAGAAALALALAGTARAETGALPLEELMERMAATPGVAARYVEEAELALLTVPLVSRGVLYFVPPDRFARFTTEPGPDALIVDGESVRFRDARDGTELDLSAEPMALQYVDNFTLLFRGDLAALRQRYELDYAAEGERWTLRLTPRSARIAALVRDVTLRGDGAGLRELVVRETNGDRRATRFEETELDRRFSAPELHQIFSAGRPLSPNAADR